MDDLRSELDTIADNGDASNSQQDRPSSPLQPNSKYCSMVQPKSAMRSAAPRRYSNTHQYSGYSNPHRYSGYGSSHQYSGYGSSHQSMPRRASVSPPRRERRSPSYSEDRDCSRQTVTGPIAGPRNTAPRLSDEPSVPIQPRQIVQRRASTPPSTSRAPAVFRAALTGMELDDDGQATERPSSPLRPNEKYCSIVAPSRPPVARVAPITSVQPQRPQQGLHWTPDDEFTTGSSPTYPAYRNPILPSQNIHAPLYPAIYNYPLLLAGLNTLHQTAGYSTPHIPPGFNIPHQSSGYHNLNQPPGYSNPHQPARYGGSHESIDRRQSVSPPRRERRSPSYSEESIAGHWSREPEPASHHNNQSLDIGNHSQNAHIYARSQEIARLQQIEEQRRLKQEAARRSMIETNTRNRELARLQQMEEQRRLAEERTRRVTEEIRQRAEAERQRTEELERRRNAEDDRFKRAQAAQLELQRQAAERAKAADEERRRNEAAERERLARAKMKSYKDAPQQREHIVQMTLKELAANNEQCIAKGRQSALDEMRRSAEAEKRLERSLVKCDTRWNDEPEPMDVEESDSVESSVPSTSGRLIAPKPLIIKVEPAEQPQPNSLVDVRVDEIPLPAAPYVQQPRPDQESENDDEEGVSIIKKPVETVDLSSDDEDTIAAYSVPRKVVVKQEPHNSLPLDDDVYVIGFKRAARPKKIVYDPSKVKVEKDDASQPKAESTSESIPFNPAKVKAEPVDKRTTAGAKADAAPKSATVKTETTEEVREEETIEFVPVPPPSQPDKQQKAAGAPVKPEPVEEPCDDRITIEQPARLPSPSLPDYEEVAEGGEEVVTPPVPQPQPIDEIPRQEGGVVEMSLQEAMAAARRIIGQESETVQAVKPRLQLSNMNRKRKERWDADEDEKDWLHDREEGCTCLWGAIKRMRFDDEEEDDEDREKQEEIFANLAQKRTQ